MKAALLLALTVSVAGCASWPDLGIEGDTNGATRYPTLAPIDTLLAQGAPPQSAPETPTPTETLEARAASLRARAAVLSQPAEDAEALEDIRRRLAAGAE